MATGSVVDNIIDIRQAWACRDLMPVVPVIGVGLSPIAQWIVLPSLGFWWAGRLKERDGEIDRQEPAPRIN